MLNINFMLELEKRREFLFILSKLLSSREKVEKCHEFDLRQDAKMPTICSRDPESASLVT